MKIFKFKRRFIALLLCMMMLLGLMPGTANALDMSTTEETLKPTSSNSSLTLASDHYYSNLSSATRAQIFTGYISYATIKEKVYYELIDKALYAQIGLLQEQGDFATAQSLIELIQNEEYHEETIENNYPDTHDFLNSIYNMRNTIGDY